MTEGARTTANHLLCWAKKAGFWRRRLLVYLKNTAKTEFLLKSKHGWALWLLEKSYVSELNFNGPLIVWAFVCCVGVIRLEAKSTICQWCQVWSGQDWLYFGRESKCFREWHDPIRRHSSTLIIHQFVLTKTIIEVRRWWSALKKRSKMFVQLNRSCVGALIVN